MSGSQRDRAERSQPGRLSASLSLALFAALGAVSCRAPDTASERPVEVKPEPQGVHETIGSDVTSPASPDRDFTPPRPSKATAKSYIRTSPNDIDFEIPSSQTPASTPSPTFELPEIMGGGVALFDFDLDGDLDLLQARWPHRHDVPRPRAPNHLYEQRPDGSFRDVTSQSGLGDPGYGQGVAIGDFDDDGDPDVYMTNLGRDTLYRNQGDGTFIEITDTAGIEDDQWSTSAAFFDYDRDNDLDLFVAHYVEYTPSKRCQGLDETRDYCGPQEYPGATDKLYRNEGDGSFSNVSESAGILSPGKGLGVLTADFTDDGLVDIYVANDGEANHLWVNRGDGSFEDEAILRGVGLNAYGRAEASMGIAIGDTNHDGGLDVFLTHLAGETNTLYMATADPIYTDTSDGSGLSAIDIRFTGFGCGFLDLDHDGDLDLVVANGRVKRGTLLPGADADSFWGRYAEPNLLLENIGSGRFRDATATAPELAGFVEVSRGLAFGDVDQDGDVDFVVGNLEPSVRVFRNNAPPRDNAWLTIRALTGNRDALGARVSVEAEGKRWERLVLASYSYASSNDPRVHFGLGDVRSIDHIEVEWADGSRERFAVTGINQHLIVQQGKGESF